MTFRNVEIVGARDIVQWVRCLLACSPPSIDAGTHRPTPAFARIDSWGQTLCKRKKELGIIIE